MLTKVSDSCFNVPQKIILKVGPFVFSLPDSMAGRYDKTWQLLTLAKCYTFVTCNHRTRQSQKSRNQDLPNIIKITIGMKVIVTLGSGRDKRRLKTMRGKEIFEGRLQRTKVLGASAASPVSKRLFEEFQGKGLSRERALKSSAKS